MTDHETFLLLAAKRISEPLSRRGRSRSRGALGGLSELSVDRRGHARDDIRLRAELGAVTVSPRVRRRVLEEAAGRRRIDPR